METEFGGFAGTQLKRSAFRTHLINCSILFTYPDHSGASKKLSGPFVDSFRRGHM